MSASLSDVCAENVRTREEERRGFDSLSLKEPESQNQNQSQKLDARKFTKPTLDEVRREVVARGFKLDPETFWHFHESKGWKIGNQPMKNWKSALVTWEKRERKPNEPGVFQGEVKPLPLDPKRICDGCGKLGAMDFGKGRSVCRDCAGRVKLR